MEEDIKVLEEYLNYNATQRKISASEIIAIENLIKGYKELEVINKMQEYRINVIDEREFIPKSKVREKIEELKKERNKQDKGGKIYLFYDQIDISNIIRALEELLEGDN